MRSTVRLAPAAGALWAIMASCPTYAGEGPASHAGTACASLQAPSAEEQVRCVLGAYIEATAAADAKLARSLFHADARMSGDLGSGARTGSAEPFFQALAKATARPGQGGYEASLDSISVLGDTATGNVIEKNLFGYNFTNRFHLIKLDGRWQIVSKLFYSTTPATQTTESKRQL